MQFHGNGFRPGDPEIAEAVAPPLGASPDEVDVLIVGCGPAGLTLAAQLAVFPDIRIFIIDQKPGPLQLGQADGIACRTMEMFEAFGFAERVAKEGYWVNETTFWKPDAERPAHIARSGRIPDVEEGLSEFPHVILNQARVHDFYLQAMRNAPTRLEPHYSRRLLDLAIAPASEAATHPVTVRWERIDSGHEGEIETIRARYVVGCDGARSAVRKSLGRTLVGDSANHAWGVMDVLAVTDFPDIRFKCVIQSAGEGSMLIIPREGGYLVRLYIELEKLSENERAGSLKITTDRLVAAARRILHPYHFEAKEIPWWSVYEIGQRLCDKFDDVPDDEPDRLPRVFIAGDACHTHSPKAGQGMNVSMQDSFNLGWKLAAVIRGRSALELLRTYSSERQAIAKELIDFDREFARMFSAASKPGGNVDPAQFQAHFTRQGRFTAGTETRYAPSILTGEPRWQGLAKGLTIGMRFHSAPVIRLADAKPVHLGHTVKADGRWRLFLFADTANPADPKSRLRSLCEILTHSDDSPIKRFTPKDADIDSVIDVRAVFQQDHRALALEGTPALLRPTKGRLGLRDYDKMFCPVMKSELDVFDLRGVDRERGCIIVVRPDQFVANVFPLDGHFELAAFFQNVLLAV